MATRSRLRGHPIIWDNGRWIYEDDSAEVPANGGEIRPCVRCGSLFPLTESDTCLKVLPGVTNACCGHGIRSGAYVRFTNGIVLKEFIIDEEDITLGVKNESSI